MNSRSKKILSIVSGITSIVFSRVMFLFFDDAEGPNLLIVMGMAAVVYTLSSLVYRLFGPTESAFKRLTLIILIQIAIVAGLYFFLT